MTADTSVAIAVRCRSCRRRVPGRIQERTWYGRGGAVWISPHRNPIGKPCPWSNAYLELAEGFLQRMLDLTDPAAELDRVLSSLHREREETEMPQSLQSLRRCYARGH